MKKIIIFTVIASVLCATFILGLSYYKQNNVDVDNHLNKTQNVITNQGAEKISRACKVLMNMESTLNEEWVTQNYELMKQKDTEITREKICIVRIFNETNDIFAIRDFALMDNFVERDKSIDKFVNNFADTYSIDRNIVANIVQEVLDSLVPLQNAKLLKEIASVRLEIAATVRMMILCMDSNGYFINPEEEKNVCRDENYGTWPAISAYGGEWGGCEMKINRVNDIVKEFAYCATLPDGKVVHCSQSGCDFDNPIAGMKSSK